MKASFLLDVRNIKVIAGFDNKNETILDKTIKATLENCKTFRISQKEFTVRVCNIFQKLNINDYKNVLMVLLTAFLSTFMSSFAKGISFYANDWERFFCCVIFWDTDNSLASFFDEMVRFITAYRIIRNIFKNIVKNL